MDYPFKNNTKDWKKRFVASIKLYDFAYDRARELLLKKEPKFEELPVKERIDKIDDVVSTLVLIFLNGGEEE